MTVNFTPAKNQRLETMSERLQDYQQLIMTWIQGNLFELTVAAVAAVIIYFALRWVRRYCARKAAAAPNPGDMSAIIARTLARTSRFFRAMVSIELVNGYANAPDALRNTVHALFTIAVVMQAAIWAREIILGLIERRAQESDQAHDTLNNAMTIIRLLVSFILFAIAAIFILDNLGVNVTGLIAGLGVGGIAIGLAAQGIFADLFAAISMIFDKPFKRGDTVSYDQTTGRVENIGMKSTRLRALTGELKIISNSKLLDKEITNATQVHYRRTTYVLGLVYQTPVEKLRALPDLMKQVVEEHHAQFIRCVFTNFNASSLDFQLVFDTVAPELDDLLHARHEVGLSVFAALQEHGFEFAYPTQTAFTAAPDGSLILPYPDGSSSSKTQNRKTSK